VLQPVVTSASEIAPRQRSAPLRSGTGVPGEDLYQTHNQTRFEALTAIFPDECTVLSQFSLDNYEQRLQSTHYLQDHAGFGGRCVATTFYGSQIRYPLRLPTKVIAYFQADATITSCNSQRSGVASSPWKKLAGRRKACQCTRACDALIGLEVGARTQPRILRLLDRNRRTKSHRMAASSSTLPKPATAERLEQCNTRTGNSLGHSVLSWPFHRP
jgi:hypothetical protein